MQEESRKRETPESRFPLESVPAYHPPTYYWTILLKQSEKKQIIAMPCNVPNSIAVHLLDKVLHDATPICLLILPTYNGAYLTPFANEHADIWDRFFKT